MALHLRISLPIPASPAALLFLDFIGNIIPKIYKSVAALYALTTAVVTSMGYFMQPGFIHFPTPVGMFRQMRAAKRGADRHRIPAGFW